ncbi:MAG: hypothetical protein FJ279_25665, partial [Planctomycetes bacterium]|nr:hypothetical protein [Planctomycetota bacterium]
MNRTSSQESKGFHERRLTACAALILAIAALAYLNTLTSSFAWDDRFLVVKNPHIKRLSEVPHLFTSSFFPSTTDPRSAEYYRPLVALSYALEYAVAGLKPSVFHATNIVLHGLNGILVFLLCRAVFTSSALALAAGLLFAVHPIHTESVAWVAGRTDVLATLFSLLACLFFLRKASAAGDAGLSVSARSCAFFGLALLSKEVSA